MAVCCQTCGFSKVWYLRLAWPPNVKRKMKMEKKEEKEGKGQVEEGNPVPKIAKFLPSPFPSKLSVRS